MSIHKNVNVSVSLLSILNSYQRETQNEFLKDSSMNFTTHSGINIPILDFNINHVKFEDIAHGLSNLCRYGGQCSKFYSVAEHCILVSLMIELLSPIKDLRKTGLLHDASETYLVDLPTPVKILCPGYQIIEEKFENTIFEAFGLKYGFRNPIIKECDRRMYLIERSVLLPGYAHRNEDTDFHQTVAKSFNDQLKIRFLSPEDAKRAFIDRAKEIGIQEAV